MAASYASKVQCALNTIAHRGPDGHGLYIDEHAILGHVRLSIIDLSNAGQQPMKDHDNLYVVTYNGEIYNFSELKGDLDIPDSQYRSATDTEVLLMCFKNNYLCYK